MDFAGDENERDVKDDSTENDFDSKFAFASHSSPRASDSSSPSSPSVSAVADVDFVLDSDEGERAESTVGVESKRKLPVSTGVGREPENMKISNSRESVTSDGDGGQVGKVVLVESSLGSAENHAKEGRMTMDKSGGPSMSDGEDEDCRNLASVKCLSQTTENGMTIDKSGGHLMSDGEDEDGHNLASTECLSQATENGMVKSSFESTENVDGVNSTALAKTKDSPTSDNLDEGVPMLGVEGLSISAEDGGEISRVDSMDIDVEVQPSSTKMESEVVADVDNPGAMVDVELTSDSVLSTNLQAPFEPRRSSRKALLHNKPFTTDTTFRKISGGRRKKLSKNVRVDLQVGNHSNEENCIKCLLVRL